MKQVFIAVFSTIICGYFAALVEPMLGVIVAISVMGGFIYSEIRTK